MYRGNSEGPRDLERDTKTTDAIADLGILSRGEVFPVNLDARSGGYTVSRKHFDEYLREWLC